MYLQSFWYICAQYVLVYYQYCCYFYYMILSSLAGWRECGGHRFYKQRGYIWVYENSWDLVPRELHFYSKAECKPFSRHLPIPGWTFPSLVDLWALSSCSLYFLLSPLFWQLTREATPPTFQSPLSTEAQAVRLHSPTAVIGMNCHTSGWVVMCTTPAETPDEA